VFVFPTLSDAFGLTQLECMAWRLPLIASRHCGTVVRDGQNGLLLQELTPSSIAAALLRCLGSPASLALWSSACAVPAQCSMDSFAGSLQEIERRLYPVSA
jgi:glycosyltransferase involved in cell wall biosynthesis